MCLVLLRGLCKNIAHMYGSSLVMAGTVKFQFYERILTIYIHVYSET